MILYSTRDIINKAQQLSDLQNSDYIGYNENLTLLNDAYSKLYQKAINAGDKIYLKRMELTPSSCGEYTNGVAYELPCDFYQIYSVKGGNGYYSHPILRKPKDEVGITSGYDIINNQLVTYGFTDVNIEVEYFPVPDTLYIANKDLELKDYDGTPLCYSETNLITLAGTKVLVYDLSTSYKIAEWELGEGAKVVKAEAGVNQAIVHFTREGSRFVLTAGYNELTGNIVEDTGKLTMRYSSDNSVFQVENTLNAKAAISCGDFTYYAIGEELVCYEGDRELYREALPGATDITFDYFFDDKIYMVDDGKLYTFNVNDRCLEEITTNRSERVVSVGRIDLKTGYGYLINKMGRGYYITSCFVDTELDYPNNFYFNYLAYMLAISYKSKQGDNADLLRGLAAEAEEQYYDTFKRDVNNCTRINNVVF